MQDMLHNKQLILPEGYGGIVPSKPPLLHWLAVLFSLPSGEVSELSARLPSILAAILIAFICFRWFSEQGSLKSATLSVLLLASSIEWLRAASASRVDMVLTAALVSAFFSIFYWAQSSFRGYPWLLMISSAAAMLCKGPVGVALPGLVLFVVLINEGVRIPLIFKRCFAVFSPALLIASCWYGAAYLSRPDRFLDKVYYENVARFLSIQDDEPHKASVFKLYGSLLVGFLPWTIVFLAALIGKIRSPGRSYLMRPDWKALRLWWKTRAKIDSFSIIVVLITLLFYSIPSGKRSVYILPVYPFISFWLARYFIKKSSQQGSRFFLNAALWVSVLFSILVAISAALIFSPGASLLSLIPNSLSAVFTELQLNLKSYLTGTSLALCFTVISFGAAVSFILLTFLRAKKQAGLQWLVASIFSLILFIQLVLVPAVINPISPKVFAAQLGAVVNSETELLSYGEEFYGLSFYAPRRFLRAEEVGFKVGAVVVVADDDLEKLSKALPPGVSLDLISWSSGSVMSYGKRLGIFKILG